jgi:ribonuclease BN (tRNA processing enzyme)
MPAYFCGTRGSTPVNGAEHLHYGGHTSCIGLAHAGEPPTIVLDGGTGLQRLSLVLGGQAFRGTLLLSHLHWDHTHGMPFFRSGALPGSRVDVYLPEQGVEPEELLARAICLPISRSGPSSSEMAGPSTRSSPGTTSSRVSRWTRWRSRTKAAARSVTGSATVPARWLTFQITARDSLGPGPDGTGVIHEAAITLTEGADLLVHDSQHTAAELPRLGFLGHSAIEYAVALAQRANARQFALFHHDPWRTDAEIDALVGQHAAAPVRVFAAHDGMVMDLP